jgi:hypothetical protein
MTAQSSAAAPPDQTNAAPLPRRWPLRRKAAATDVPLPGARFTTIIGLCAMTGLSESSVHAIIARGELKRLKAGRRTLLCMEEIGRWLRSRGEVAAPEPQSAPAEQACPRCQGTIWWRTAVRTVLACKRCVPPGRAARHGGYTEVGLITA